MDEILSPIALVLGVLGAAAGVFALWGLLLVRRQILGGEPTLPAAVAQLQGRVSTLEGAVQSMDGLLHGLQGTAVRYVDVLPYAHPGESASKSVLIAIRDGTGKNGVLIHNVGSPQMRALPLKDGVLVSGSGGVVMQAERDFIDHLLAVVTKE